MTVYIYGLVCPTAGVVRYIGKSIDPEKRLRAHIMAAARGDYNHHTARWLRKLHQAGLSPTLTILGEVAAGESWQDLERKHIADALAKGVRLTNSTAGGEGLDYLDPVDHARYIANLSASLKRIWSTPEKRLEAKQRSMKAWADPEVTARRLASMTKAANRPDVKAKVATVLDRLAKDPEIRAKKSRASKEYWNSDAGKSVRTALMNETTFLADQSVRLKNRWKDETHRAKMQNARWTPEKRAEQAARIATRRERMLAARTPEVRAKQGQSLRENWAHRKAQQQT